MSTTVKAKIQNPDSTAKGLVLARDALASHEASEGAYVAQFDAISAVLQAMRATSGLSSAVTYKSEIEVQFEQVSALMDARAIWEVAAFKVAEENFTATPEADHVATAKSAVVALENVKLALFGENQ